MSTRKELIVKIADLADREMESEDADLYAVATLLRAAAHLVERADERSLVQGSLERLTAKLRSRRPSG